MAIIKMGRVLDLNAIIDSIYQKKFPIGTSYKIVKIKEDVKKELEFYREKFNEIVQEFGDKDENGNLLFKRDVDANGNEIPGTESIKIQEGKIDECNKVLEELQQIDVEIDTRGLSVEDLGNVEFSASELEVLVPFLE